MLMVNCCSRKNITNCDSLNPLLIASHLFRQLTPCPVGISTRQLKPHYQHSSGADPGGPRAPLTTKNEAPAPKFYKIEVPEWQFEALKNFFSQNFSLTSLGINSLHCTMYIYHEHCIMIFMHYRLIFE